MLRIGDTILIERNFLIHMKDNVKKKSIPEGVYEVVDAQYEKRRDKKPFFSLSKMGIEGKPLIVERHSFETSIKWRKL